MAKPTVHPRALRERLGLNQVDFWGRIHVTQSGGSRYESGRPMPKPVRALLGIVYLRETANPYVSKRRNGRSK